MFHWEYEKLFQYYLINICLSCQNEVSLFGFDIFSCDTGKVNHSSTRGRQHHDFSIDKYNIRKGVKK